MLKNILMKKSSSLIVVDVSSGLKLMYVGLTAHPQVQALTITPIKNLLPQENSLNAIRDFLRTNQIQERGAILIPALGSIFSKRLLLPLMPESEIPEAIKWQIKKELPVAIDEAVIDFAILGQKTKEDGTNLLDCVCLAAKEKEIEEQVLVLKQAGLSCVAVIPFISSYISIVEKYLSGRKNEPAGILHLGDDYSFFVIERDNKLEFFRQLPVSLNKLRNSLTGTLALDKGKVQLNAEEIEEVLFKVGVTKDNIVYKNKLNSFQISSLLRQDLERLSLELKRSVNYYTSQFNGQAVNSLFLAGPGLSIPHLDEFLHNDVQIAVSKISVPDEIIKSPAIGPDDLLNGLGSLGAALDYKENFNLMPRAFRSERIEKIQKVSLRLIAFIIVSLLAFSSLVAWAGVKAYRQRLKNAALHLGALSEIKDTKMKVDGLNNFINNARDSQPPIYGILKKISNAAGKQVFLESLILNAKTGIMNVTGSLRLSESGREEILTRFVGAMEKSGYFTGANINSVEKSVNENNSEVLNFSVDFKLP
ncbi:MAG: pilus assembly protein PilM [Candidatus Omnitrophota bacterium]